VEKEAPGSFEALKELLYFIPKHGEDDAMKASK
jgi:hypothetical protein